MSLRIRALRVLASALATALLLAGLTQAYRWGTQRQPLARALAEEPAVVAYAVRGEAGGPVVEVTLGPVPNLREAYLRLEERVARAAGRPVRLVIRDRRDPRLLADYYALHYVVQEAIDRGAYAAAAARLQEAARRRGLDRLGFYVDRRFVYLQLHRGDRYLYEVIPRPPQGVAPS